jgi:uncharacterized repeat protein (TIGR01451 family)
MPENTFRRRRGLLALRLSAFLLSILAARSGSGAELVSINAVGTASANGASAGPSASFDGAVIAFQSAATNLVTGFSDTNGATDVFRRNTQTGFNDLISVNSAGTGTGNGASGSPSMSFFSQVVAFDSVASDLVTNDGNGHRDVFARDMTFFPFVTKLVSVNAAGTGGGNGDSHDPVVSADGRWVVFLSSATDLVGGGVSYTPGMDNVFVRDLQSNLTRLVSVNPAGNAAGNAASVLPISITGDGSAVAFVSNASNLVAAGVDANGVPDVFVRNVSGAITTLVSLNTAGSGSGNGASFGALIARDGRYVAFTSLATNLVTGIADGNGAEDVFRRDLSTATTSLASVSAAGSASGNGASTTAAGGNFLTPDGQKVAFVSTASNLVSSVTDSNGVSDVFLRDVSGNTTEAMSVIPAGDMTGNSASNGPLSVSFFGDWVSFQSAATDLVSVSGPQRQSVQANGVTHVNVFARNRSGFKTTLVSRNASGDGGGNADSGPGLLSDDGRFAVFTSLASDLVNTDENGASDVFLQRLCTGYLVDSTEDRHLASPSDTNCISTNGRCTLRAAVEAANNNQGFDLICVPAGLYNLTENTDIVLTDGVTIEGDGTPSTIVDGNGTVRGFDVASDVPSVAIQYLQINNGFVDEGRGGGLHVSSGANVSLFAVDFNGDVALGRGGAIAVDSGGNLDAFACNFNNNTALVGAGGGLFNQGTANLNFVYFYGNGGDGGGGAIANDGLLTVSHTAMQNNQAPSVGFGNRRGLSARRASAAGGGTARRKSPLRFGFSHGFSLAQSSIISGGGIYNESGAILTLDRSVINGNDAASGSGLYNQGGATLTNVTVSGNTSGGGPGLGISTGLANTTSLLFVTVANNSTGQGGAELDPDTPNTIQLRDSIVAGGGGGVHNCTQMVSSLGHNIENGTTCGLTGTGDQSATDPKIGPLQFNGGFTQTHNLIANSPAIDAATSGCPAEFTDQRDVPRPQGSACDIGAVEALVLSISDASVTEGNSGTTLALFTVSLGAPAPGTITVDYGTADGSATVADNDYQAQSGTLTFLAGQTSQTIGVVVNGDTKPEPDETFLVNLTNSNNARITDAQGIGTIVNDDVAASADLSISIADLPDPIATGGTLTYTVNVLNGGPSTTDVTVIDTLPGGVTFQSAGGTGWTCSQELKVVTCSRTGLAAGAAPPIAIVVTAPNSGTTLFDTASVSGSVPDPVSSNNSASASTTVSGSCSIPDTPALSISTRAGAVGDPFTLTWSSTLLGAGFYVVLESTNGGVTLTEIAQTGGTALSGRIQGLVGQTLTFGVQADGGCGRSGFGSVTLTITGLGTSCGKALAPGNLTLDKTSYAPGDTFTLSWTWPPSGSPVPVPLPPGGQFRVLFSTDGANFVPLGSGATTSMSFTGTVPSAPAGSTAYFAVSVELPCGGTASSTSDLSSPAPFTLLPGTEPPPCDPPGAPGVPTVKPVGSTNPLPTPTDFISVTFTPGAGATRHGVRINGDPTEFSTTGNSVTLPPRGSKLDPFQVFVKAYRCIPEQSSAEVASDPVALFLTPPAASFTVSANPQAGAPLVLTDTSSPQATAWLWIFDDDTLDMHQSPSHTFLVPGPHGVVLVASNGAGSSSTSQTIQVAPAGVARVAAASAISIDSTDPRRRRARVELAGRDAVLLRIRTAESVETIVFLRFLDAAGEVVAERRLSVQPGAQAVYDLGAYGLKGAFSIELVSHQKFEPALSVSGRPAVREIHR